LALKKIEFMDSWDCPYYQVSRAALIITSVVKKRLAGEGLSLVKPAYLWALVSLWRDEGLKVVELGRRAGLETSTMTGLIDRMERDGLVERRSDPQDRRAQRIVLTDLGRSVKGKVFEILDESLAEVFADIPEDDLEKVGEVLKRVLVSAGKEGSDEP